MSCACAGVVAARHFTELIAWQLADLLRQEVIAFTGKPPVCWDRRFCSDIRGSAESACSNTAEGFGRFRPTDFLRSLEIARGELEETQDHLKSALHREYLTEADHQRMWRLAVRAITANTGLQKYLRTKGRHGPVTRRQPSEPREP
ncbi:MAG: four helix bundle protein [Vicinamibacterales bacterium]